MRHKRKAVTLMEVVVVVAILAIVAAISFPIVYAMWDDTELDAAADAVQAQLTRARNRAMEERRPYRFAVKENSAEYRIAPDSPLYWDAETVTPEGLMAVEEHEPLEVVGIIPGRKIKFGSVGDAGSYSGDWLIVAVFHANGSANQNQELQLGVEGLAPKIIRVEATTGAITTASLPAVSASY